jgi:hypothetical protein
VRFIRIAVGNKIFGIKQKNCPQGQQRKVKMNKRNQTWKVRVTIVAMCVAVVTFTALADQYWVAPNGTGNWYDKYWAWPASNPPVAWDNSGKCAYFNLPVNTIDLNGQSPTLYTLRTESGIFSPLNRCVVNICNTGADSKITFKNIGSDVSDMKNMVLTFGGRDSTGKIAVYLNKENYNTRSFILKNDSHIVFDSNSEYTESNGVTPYNKIGDSANTTNSMTVKAGANVTMQGQLQLGTVNGGIGNIFVDGGTLTTLQQLRLGQEPGGKGNVTVNDGLLNVASFFVVGGVGGTGTLTINGGLVKNTQYDMTIGENANSSGTVSVNAGGKYINEADNYGIRVGKLSPATVNVNGGEIELTNGGGLTLCLSGGNTSGKATINVTDGGSITTKFISHNGGAGSGTLNINNGTIRATEDRNDFIHAHDRLTVAAGVGGAVFDTNGKNISIAKGITGSGAIKLIGGGTVSFSAAPAGKVYVANGTTLTVPTKAVADAILSHGLEIFGISALGTYTVLTCDEDLAGADTGRVTCGAANGCVAGVDGNSIVVTVSAIKPGVWTGAAGDGNLSTPENWSDNMVPTSGSAEIWCATNTTLTKGTTFVPSSITFAANSAKVTIDGGELAGITAITNHSAVSHLFNCAVSGDTIDFVNDTMRCVFRGGITVRAPVFNHSPITPYEARELVGNWTITGETWTPVTCNSVGYGDLIGSSVTVLGELLNPNNLNIASGSVVTAATIRVTTSVYPVYDNNGRLVVTGMANIANTSSDFSLVREKTQDATLIFGGMTFNTSKWPWLNAKNLVVGEGGFNFSNNGRMFIRFSNENGVMLHPRDETLTFGGGIDNLEQIYTIDHNTVLTVCTTRFETHEPATVNINGKINSFVKSNYDGGMAVTGNGTVVFNSVSDFIGGLDVGDTATVRVNAGCTPGSGTVSVGANAILEVAESGTVTLGGDLTLADGATLGFNFTERRTTPKLDVTGKTVIAEGTVNVKVTFAEDIIPQGGCHILTSGGAFAGKTVSLVDKPDWVNGVSVNADGDIVLEMKKSGLILIVK